MDRMKKNLLKNFMYFGYRAMESYFYALDLQFDDTKSSYEYLEQANIFYKNYTILRQCIIER